MDDPPPTYQEATERAPLKLIAPHVSPHDLYSASLVSKSWNETFMEQLWKEPFGKFAGTRDHQDMVRLFMLCIRRARDETRALVTTLNATGMRDAMSEDRWITICLKHLPSLRSISMSSLTNLQGAVKSLDQPPFVETTAVRAMDASRSLHMGPIAMAECLVRFYKLTYLDISYTRAIVGTRVFDMCSKLLLPYLQVFKARKVGMTDDLALALVKAIGIRVWSLDLRDNKLTDTAVAHLLDYCFPPPEYNSEVPDLSPSVASKEDPPTQVNPSPSRPTTATTPKTPWFSPPSWSDHFPTPTHPASPLEDTWPAYTAIASNPAHHLYPPELRPTIGTGLTHLYLSSNAITSTGFSSLLATGRLRALDCGTVLLPPSTPLAHPPSITLSQAGLIYGAYALLPSLRLPSTRRTLQYLRINHHLVTGASSLSSSHPHLLPSTLDPSFPPLPQALYTHPLPATTLVLTSLPTSAPYSPLTRALKLFCLHAALHEAHLAHTLHHARHPASRIPAHGYPVPTPEQAKYLRQLVLELEPREADDGFTDDPRAYKQALESLASDADAVAFHKAVEGDFSFFSSGEDEGRRAKAIRWGDEVGRELPAVVVKDCASGGETKGKGREEGEGWETVFGACERSLDFDDESGRDASGGVGVAEEMRRFGRDRIWPAAVRYDEPGRRGEEMDWSGRVVVVQGRRES